jgi:hypothetical protein
VHASMKASTKAGSLGGSRLNPKGTRWESVGTSWSTGGDEVTSGADCTVVSGMRVTPSKSSRACWRRPSAWSWRVAGKWRSSSSQTRGRRPKCPPLGRRRLARQPTKCRLLLSLGCPASSSIGGGGDGTNPNVVLPPRGEDVVDSTAGGRVVGRHYRCRAAEEGVSCRSCRQGT